LAPPADLPWSYGGMWDFFESANYFPPSGSGSPLSFMLSDSSISSPRSDCCWPFCLRLGFMWKFFAWILCCFFSSSAAFRDWNFLPYMEFWYFSLSFLRNIVCASFVRILYEVTVQQVLSAGFSRSRFLVFASSSVLGWCWSFEPVSLIYLGVTVVCEYLWEYPLWLVFDYCY